MKTYPIKLVQYGVLTDEELTQNGLLCYKDDEYFIDLNGDNVFYQFHDTQSRFYAILEIEKENFYKCFELNLIADFYGDDLEDFEIIKNQEYNKMVTFLLEEELSEKLSKKSNIEKKHKI